MTGTREDRAMAWRLVPVEPTLEMLHAATMQVPTWDDEASRRKWQAMLAAAPQPPMTGTREVEALCGVLDERDLGMAEWRAMQMRIARTLRALVAERDELRGDVDKLRDDVRRWITAALASTMPDEFGLAFDPTHPEGWAHSRREVFARVLDERDALTAQLAAARADVEFIEEHEATVRHRAVNARQSDGADADAEWWEVVVRGVVYAGESLRAALDAAKGGA